MITLLASLSDGEDSIIPCDMVTAGVVVGLVVLVVYLSRRGGGRTEP